MSYHVLVDKAHRVCALTEVGENWGVKCLIVEFLQEKANNKNYAASAKGLAATMDRYGERGRNSVTSEMFHEVDKTNGIWEFIRGDLRVLCFVEGNTAYLTNAYVKKSQKADPFEVSRAVTAKKNFLKSTPGRKG